MHTINSKKKMPFIIMNYKKLIIKINKIKLITSILQLVELESENENVIVSTYAFTGVVCVTLIKLESSDIKVYKHF